MMRRLLALGGGAALVLSLSVSALAQASDSLRTPLPAPVKVKQGMLNVPALSPLWLLPEFAAKHNVASIRVLEKCGFTRAPIEDADDDEVLLKLEA